MGVVAGLAAPWFSVLCTHECSAWCSCRCRHISQSVLPSLSLSTNKSLFGTCRASRLTCERHGAPAPCAAACGANLSIWYAKPHSFLLTRCHAQALQSHVPPRCVGLIKPHISARAAGAYQSQHNASSAGVHVARQSAVFNSSLSSCPVAVSVHRLERICPTLYSHVGL
jgi:hypothetical protein